MIEWIATHHTGTSSKTMWTALMDVKPTISNFYDIPYDADDFSRCHDLVKFCAVDPQTDFPKILSVFPWYEPVLKRWGELAKCYEGKDWEAFYVLMESAMNEYRQMRNIKVL